MNGYGFHYGPCNGKALTAGGVAVLAGAVFAFAERHAIGQALGEAVTIAEVVMAVVVAAVPAAVVLSVIVAAAFL